ncbi:Ig-like domain-containing protein [Polaribacter sp. ALD11]|uniref:Ig-like domain-containing protein n=1 Tax=Polaribacter sp. ALD11 TaxID=2058137 RepID=UPI0012FE1FD2|nr:Ig-like domain-containing protein [Polaribacter sp. ALD11]
MQQLYNFLFFSSKSKKIRKNVFLSLFFISFCLTTNSQTFDLTPATTTDNTPTDVTETISGITMTIVTKNSGANNTAIANVPAFGTNQIAFHNSGSTNTEEMIISFSIPVNVNTIRVISAQTIHSRTWTFTPTGGTNTAVNETNTFASSTDVALGFIGVNSITITSNFSGGNQEQIVFDQLTLGSVNNAPIATAFPAPTVAEDDTNIALDDTVSITDAEAGDTQTATFTITGGILTLGTSGITFGGAGNGSASFTAEGSLTDINKALDAATFTPTAGLNGTLAGIIAFTTNDGTANSNNATVTFDITAVNDEPSFTVRTQEVVDEDAGPQTVTGFATALEDGDAEVTQTLLFNVSNNNNGLFSAQPAIDASGNLTYTTATNLFGTATVMVNIMDNGGTANVGDDDTSDNRTFTITVNQVNNTPVVITSISDDTGASTTDYITNDNKPTVNGTAEPGSIITLIINGTPTTTFGVTGTTNSMGVFAFRFPAVFGSLRNNATATISARAELNRITLSSPNQSVTVDTDDPAVPTVVQQTTNDTTPTITGTNALGTALPTGETMTVTVNGATYNVVPNASGNWSLDIGSDTPAAGSIGTFIGGVSFEVVATVTDLAGNTATDISNFEITIDTTDPTVPTVVAQTTNNVTPTITGTNALGTALPSSETMTVIVNGATYNVVPNGTGNWTVNVGTDTPAAGTLGTFVNGVSYEVVATVTDLAGNTATDATSFELTIDNTAGPTDPVVTTPASAITVGTTTQTISGTHTENGVTVNAYADANNDGTADNATSLGSATVIGNTWSFAVSLTAESNNNFVVAAEDTAGNTSNDVDVSTVTQTNTVTWIGVTNINWSEPSNWNTNTVPTSTSDVIIPAGTPFPVTTYTSVTVNTINISSGASLIANSTVNAKVTYTRNLPTTNWYLVATPFNNTTQDDLIANNTFASGTGSNIGVALYNNDGSNPWTYANAASTGPVVRGYGASVKLATPGNIAITGNINPFNVTVPITTGSRNNFNLLGNPYTSFINSFTLTNQNSSKLEEQTIWLWDGTQYTTRNAMTPLEIAPTQGFFVEAFNALPGGTMNLTYSSSNQSHQSDTFSKKEPAPSFELFIENDGDKKSTRVFYAENKTKGFDNGYDSKMFGGVTYDLAVYTQLLSDNDGRKLAIQTLPKSNYEDMVIPIGIIAKANETLTLSIESLNLPENINVFLEDRVNNKFINLTEKDYKITLEEDSKDVGQFYIHTTSSKSLSIENNLNLDNVSVYKTNNSNLRLTGLPLGNTNLTIYNILGKQVKQTSFNSNGVKDISLPQLSKGIYLVKLETENGKLNKKIILE